MLKVVGSKKKEESQRKYLHRGIAARDFPLRFQLAAHVKAIGAAMESSLLSVELVRKIPEAMKPHKIAINGVSVNAVESKPAPQLESADEKNDAQPE